MNSETSAQKQQEESIAGYLAEFFDPVWYTERYGDVAGTGLTPIVHFMRIGVAELRDPNAFFASEWYLEQHPDVRASRMHPLVHYLRSGGAELRDPHPDFDAIWYVDRHPEAIANPLLYHIRIGRGRRYPTKPPAGRQKPAGPELQEAALIASLEGFFDADWYRQSYPDTIASDLEPISHFIRHGIAERRDPNRFFDSRMSAPAGCIRWCIICSPVPQNCAIRTQTLMRHGMQTNTRTPRATRCFIMFARGPRAAT